MTEQQICPSATGETPGAQIIGFIGADGVVANIPTPIPLTDEMLKDWPSGDLFGLVQNAGMGWTSAEVARDPFLILSTQGGLRICVFGVLRHTFGEILNCPF